MPIKFNNLPPDFEGEELELEQVIRSSLFEEFEPFSSLEIDAEGKEETIPLDVEKFGLGDSITKLDLIKLLGKLLYSLPKKPLVEPVDPPPSNSNRNPSVLARTHRIRGTVPIGGILAFHPNNILDFFTSNELKFKNADAVSTDRAEFRKKVLARWLWDQGFAICDGSNISDYFVKFVKNDPGENVRQRNNIQRGTLLGNLPYLNPLEDFEMPENPEEQPKFPLMPRFLRGGTVLGACKLQAHAIQDHAHLFLKNSLLHDHSVEDSPLPDHGHHLEPQLHNHQVSISIPVVNKDSTNPGATLGLSLGAPSGTKTFTENTTKDGSAVKGVNNIGSQLDHGHITNEIDPIGNNPHASGKRTDTVLSESHLSPGGPENPASAHISREESRPINHSIIWIMRVR